MSNDPLIDRLLSDLRPVRPRSGRRDALLLAAICGTELALFLLLGLVRPDMPMAMAQPSWWWKLCSLAAIASGGFTVAVLSLDPTRSPRRGLRAVLAVVLLCLLSGWALDVARDGASELWRRLDWGHGVQCAIKMALLALPAAVGMSVLVRRGAPTDRAGTAWAGAIASAAWGAFVFVFACPSDDPFYITVWYLVGCGATAAGTRTVLGALARW
jgi:hypothetical protein